MMNQTVSDIIETRLQQTEYLYRRFDHLLLDACSLIKGPEAFFTFLYKIAPEIQREKYPNNERAFILVPQSVGNEIVKCSQGRNSDSTPESIANGQRAVERFCKMRDLGILALVQDQALNSFGDSGILSLAMAANSCRSILFITNDNNLGQDIQNLPSLRSIHGFRHAVRRIDEDGFLANIKPASVVVPISRPRGHGMYERYSCTGQLPEQPRRLLDALGAMDEGDVLYTVGGSPIVLGTEIAGGAESQIFMLQDSDSQCVKVFRAPDSWKQAKVEMLASRNFELDGVVLPDVPLYTGDRVFKGYIMPFLSNTIPLSTLFNGKAREKHIVSSDPDQSLDRRYFAALALKLAEAYKKAHIKGLLLADISCANVRVKLNSEGMATDQVYIIDTDSAQLGSSKGPIYAPDGITPQYTAREVLEAGWNHNELRSYSSELFSIWLLVGRVLMAGLHPFRAVNQSSDDYFDEVAAIKAGKLPYGCSDERKSYGLLSPGLGSFIWSNMPRALKNRLHRALTCTPDERREQASLISTRGDAKGLIPSIESYIAWLDADTTPEQFPQARMLTPTRFKPFITKCSGTACGGIFFDLANTPDSVKRDNVFLCPTCAAEPATYCAECGTPTLTRGEQLLGKKKFRTCAACFNKSSAQALNRIAGYRQCSCGRSFSITMAEMNNLPDLCPDCRQAAGADPTP